MQREKDMDFPRILNIVTGFLSFGTIPDDENYESIEEMIKEVEERIYPDHLEDLTRESCPECWWDHLYVKQLLA